MSRSNAPLRVLLAAPAKDDLVEISSWYAERHPSGESRFVEAFVNARDLLALHPTIGRERSELRAGLRSWPVHPFTIFYEVATRSRVLTIERVIHGRIEIDEDDFPS